MFLLNSFLRAQVANGLILAYLDFTKCISISVVRLARGLTFSSACPGASASPEVHASVHGRH